MSVFLRKVLLLAIPLMLLAGCSEQPQAPVSGPPVNLIGQPAHDFTLTDMQGRQVTLSQFRGKVVILNFWATWCPPCREEMPSMERLYKNFAVKGLVLLAVNVEQNGYQAVSSFLNRTPYSFPILLDINAQVQNLYGVYRFPESFLIDRNGNVVDKIIGGRDWMSGPIVKKVNFLLGG